MLVWPARIVTQQATYDPAHFRAARGEIAELLDKQGNVIETLSEPSWSLVAEGPATGQPHVKQRWQVESPDGTRWLVELLGSCGCGSTRTTGSNLNELAW